MNNIFENWRKFTESEGKTGTIKTLSANKQAAAEAAFNTLSAENVFRDASTAGLYEKSLKLDYDVSFHKSPTEEIVTRFVESLYSGKRSGFLTYYSESELAACDLYLVKGHQAGFAIKPDGDIVSVHNNSELRSLGELFLKKAISSGGSKLDHFDGFLSGLYRKFGFTDVYEVYQWDEQYKPEKWSYNKIDVFDESMSVYSEPLNEFANVGKEIIVNAEDSFPIKIVPADKVNQYKWGRPDVIFRRFG